MPPVRTAPGTIPHIPLAEYRDKFAEFFILERSDSGVLMARMHTDGDSLVWDYPVHRAIHQLTTYAGQDVENEVFILAGSGHNWMAEIRPSVEENAHNRAWMAYEHNYYDGANMCEGLVFDLEIPTIGVINGPGFHTELALLCDLTIASNDAVIVDPHIAMNWVPGDGIQIALREAMGTKRANYAMLTAERIDAQRALQYGLVNEVVEKTAIYDRAWELGEQLAKTSRVVRRVTTQVLRAPLKNVVANELRHAFGAEMFAALSTAAIHDEKLVDQIMSETGAEISRGSRR